MNKKEKKDFDNFVRMSHKLAIQRFKLQISNQ